MGDSDIGRWVLLLLDGHLCVSLSSPSLLSLSSPIGRVGLNVAGNDDYLKSPSSFSPSSLFPLRRKASEKEEMVEKKRRVRERRRTYLGRKGEITKWGIFGCGEEEERQGQRPVRKEMTTTYVVVVIVCVCRGCEGGEKGLDTHKG